MATPFIHPQASCEAANVGDDTRVWGFAVVADSAQFSACVSELAEPEYVGSALTLQTAIGFLLTVVTIRLVPTWEAAWGWRWAFAPLAIGPILGTWSMLALRRRPEASRIARGCGGLGSHALPG